MNPVKQNIRVFHVHDSGSKLNSCFLTFVLETSIIHAFNCSLNLLKIVLGKKTLEKSFPKKVNSLNLDSP